MTKILLKPLREYFNIAKGNAKRVSKRKQSTLKDALPLITSSAINDGVSMFTVPIKTLKLDKYKKPEKTKNGHLKYQTDTIFKNTLTVNSNGSIGYVFYHPYKFIASSDVSILNIKNNKTNNKYFIMNKWVALYLKASIEKQRDRFQFGFKLTIDRLKALKIYLPITSSGLIDVNYITKLIKSIYNNKNKSAPHYKLINPKYSLTKLTNNKSRPWTLFKIKEIFGNVVSGRHYPQRLRTKGSLPFVSSSARNNGVKDFCSNNLYLNAHSNTISVSGVGLSGCAFYHQHTFINDRDAHILIDPKFKINLYNALFICTCIYQQHTQFQYGFILNTDRLKNLKINLPITVSSYKMFKKMHKRKYLHPDYQFMNNYIKSMIKD